MINGKAVWKCKWVLKLPKLEDLNHDKMLTVAYLGLTICQQDKDILIMK
jgi:hypothetical protein